MSCNPTSPLRVEYRPIEELIPYACNPRVHPPEQITQIANSIDCYGLNNPVLIDPDGSIIAGHARVLAARQLGLQFVPVIVLAHLNEDQKRAFRIADNKLALNAAWDEKALALELQALVEKASAELTGFDQKEIKSLLATLSRQALTDPDEIPPSNDEVTTRPGDLWVLGNHRLLCGDGTKPEDLQRLSNGAPSAMVFTDLPYNADYEGKTRRRLKIANDNLGDQFESLLQAACRSMLAVNDGAIYICMSSRELHRLYAAFTAAGGHWSTYIIWAKSNFTLGRSDFQRQYEPILYGWREGGRHYWCGDRKQGDVWSIDKPRQNKEHPTMKPVELVERAIGNSSREGDIVLDPFAGSGSTVLAAERTGRLARVVEIEPRYADVIVRRWQEYSGEKAHLDPCGESFDQVADERRTKNKRLDQAA